MAEVVLRDIDPLLMERIRRLSVARGWTREETCLALLEQGLFASEHHVRRGPSQQSQPCSAEPCSAGAFPVKPLPSMARHYRLSLPLKPDGSRPESAARVRR